MVTIENWEEYAILRTDGELDAAGLQALEAFLAAHPELAEEARLYDSMRLIPDEAVVFAGKESLLKSEPRIIALDRRWMWAAAAGVALLIGATALLRTGEAGNGSAAGGTIAGRVKVKAAPVPATPSLPSVPVVADPDEAVVATPVQPAMAKKSTHKPSGTSAPSITLPQRPNNAEIAPTDAVMPLSSVDSRFLAVATPEHRTAGHSGEYPFPATAAVETPQSEGGSLLARLAPDRDRLQLVDDIRATASSRITALRATREKLRNSDVTVSVGRRDLFTIHF